MTKSSNPNKPTRTRWLILHLGVPLFPFFVKVLIRFINGLPRLGIDMFDASDLALIFSFTWLFIRQSLLDTEIELKEKKAKSKLKVKIEEDIQRINSWIQGCFGFATLFFTFYVIVEVLNTLAPDLERINKTLPITISKYMIFLFFFVSTYIIPRIQSSFNLKARIQ